MADLETLFVEAANVRKAGDAAGARDRFEAILRDWPTCHEAWYMHGMLSAELGDFVAAEKGLRRALEHDDGNPEYLFRLGAVLLQQGRAEEAADLLLRAERESEESTMLLRTVGTACIEASRHGEAERAFRRLLELEPASVEGGLGLLSALMGLNRTEEALALGRSLAERHPQKATVHARLAKALERANKPDDAEAAADRALALDPDNPVALSVKATVLHRRKRGEEAVALYERALGPRASEPERRDICRLLGLLLDELGRTDEAYARLLQSKKTLEQVGPTNLAMVKEIDRFIQACRTTIPPGGTSLWPEEPAEEREPPVFFVGFPRSGTTLLEQMLGAHPRFVTTDEVSSLSRVTQRIAESVGGLEFVPGRYGGLSRREVLALRAMYWETIEAELGRDALAGKRLIDKHPMNTSNLFTARRLFPGAKVIVSLRDPRDVILSCFMHLSRTPMALVYFRDLESAAGLYAQVMGLWLHMRSALGLPWIEVKYEDLVADTEGTARRVVEFLGEEWDDAVLRYLERTRGRAIRSTSYQQVTQGIYTRALGRWKAYEKHFGRALEIVRPFVQEFGYEQD